MLIYRRKPFYLKKGFRWTQKGRQVFGNFKFRWRFVIDMKALSLIQFHEVVAKEANEIQFLSFQILMILISLDQ